MKFKTYFMALSVPEREDFAMRCKTSRAHLTNIAYDKAKTCGEDLAMAIDQESCGAVTCEELRPDLVSRWSYLRNSKKATRCQEAASEAIPQPCNDMGAVLRNDLPVQEYQRHKEGK